MNYYDLLQEDPALFFLMLLVSLVLTLVVYSVFPIIFSKKRKKPISETKYKLLCYGVNFIGMMFFIALNGASSGAPYLLWTWIFSNRGIKNLKSRGYLSDGKEVTKKIARKVSDSNDMPKTDKSAENKIRFCRKCGKTLPSDAVFCNKCGTKIITDGE